MTGHTDDYYDILGGDRGDNVRPVLDQLALMARAAAAVKAPPTVDQAILSAIRDAR
jgi:hypothetical protein